jgi:hypothetical protein
MVGAGLERHGGMALETVVVSGDATEGAGEE